MSVYKRDNPNYFKEAIESMLNQTIKTNDFVIVCDGSLTNELNKVLKDYEKEDLFNVIRIQENVGLEKALNIALPKCKNELVARMNSDDVSFNNRCERQLKIFKEKNVDIVSGTVDEYTLNMDKKTGSRVLPIEHRKIVKYSKRKSPFNHPAVMFKKEKVLKAG